MKNRVFSIILTMVVLTVSCSACSSGSNDEPSASVTAQSNVEEKLATGGTSDSSLFEWDGNTITALTDEGKKAADIIIPENCEAIKSVVFQNSSAKTVSFADDDDVKLDIMTFSSDSLEQIVLPANLSSIPNSCFQAADSLKSITIPASVTLLDNYAFSGCHSLKDIVFEGESIEIIGMECFSHCDAIETINIPEGVTTIDKNAFFDCTSLKSISLPSTLKTVGHSAFGSVPDLEDLYFSEGIELEEIGDLWLVPGNTNVNIHIKEGSWCDKNRDSWNIWNFGNIVTE